VTCTPASGSTFPLGVTTVTCSATDGGGLSAAGSFLVAVQDTTSPTLGALPDLTADTSDPSGAVVSWPTPSATDVVDPAPTVQCTPASGSAFPVGTTTVTCTARDAAGNTASGTFTVTVRAVSPVIWSAMWGEPVATNGSTFVANAGR